jgi:hypothetical protein
VRRQRLGSVAGLARLRQELDPGAVLDLEFGDDVIPQPCMGTSVSSSIASDCSPMVEGCFG